jgi:hypothetical protein
MPTDTDKKLNGTPEPFRRPMIWGRPPATVFRAGPLPKGERLPPLPEPPRAGSAAGILSGSMIPRAAPAQAQAPRPAGPSPAALTPEPREASVAARARGPAVADQAADLTVRPLPAAEPLPAVEPGRGPVRPAAPPERDASPAVRRDLERPVSPHPAVGTTIRKPARRAPLYAGIAFAAVTVLALGSWIWTRSPAEAPTPAATFAAPLVPTAETPVVERPPAPTVAEIAPEAPAPAAPLPVTRSAEPLPAATPPAVVRAAPPEPAPAPEAVAPPPAVVTTPLIEIAPAPVPGPAPTAARPPQTDPDAPIPTRPQPLD